MGDLITELSMEEICVLMPKVELHAHLNGSISESILHKLQRYERSGIPQFPQHNVTSGSSKETMAEGSDVPDPNSCHMKSPIPQLSGNRSLAECWVAFGKIHDVIRTPELLYEATCEVIYEFHRDQVTYLEIRTTPKQIHEINSKDIYVDNVIRAILDCRDQKRLPIMVKLLISIDRKMGEAEGLENIHLAHRWSKMYPNVVVGMDVSGDPNYGSYKWIVPTLAVARRLGLLISCHLPEVVNVEETLKFMEFKPDRIAHGQFLHPTTGGTEELWDLAKRLNLPIEVCITSNIITGVTSSMEEHYARHVYDENIPFAIGTDDSGVFNTSLSTEYKKFLKLVPLTKNQLRILVVRSASYSFTSDSEKLTIKMQIEKWWKEKCNI